MMQHYYKSAIEYRYAVDTNNSASASMALANVESDVMMRCARGLLLPIFTGCTEFEGSEYLVDFEINLYKEEYPKLCEAMQHAMKKARIMKQKMLCDKRRSAIRIQRIWRNSISNPEYALCKKRLCAEIACANLNT